MKRLAFISRMAFLRADSLETAWHSLRTKLAPPCASRHCQRSSYFFRRLRHPSQGVWLQGSWYCHPKCLERALSEALPWARIVRTRTVPVAHRMPLGLMLLSCEQLTGEQLRAALHAQRSAGQGRIGEWLLALGYATEQQITTALARQWSCPVLRSDSIPWRTDHLPEIPRFLLETFHMVPVDFIPATSTLHVAFGDNIDYRVLYALEQMLECRTVPCLVRPTVLRRSLLALTERRPEKEIVFDRVADAAELARIVGSYAATTTASEVRMAPCAHYIWVRLQRTSQNVVNLLFHTASEARIPA